MYGIIDFVFEYVQVGMVFHATLFKLRPIFYICFAFVQCISNIKMNDTESKSLPEFFFIS